MICMPTRSPAIWWRRAFRGAARRWLRIRRGAPVNCRRIININAGESSANRQFFP